MNQQVRNFGSTVQQMGRYFRGDVNAVGSYLGKCIFYSGMGSNDYLNNYFMHDFYNTGSQFTAQAYADALIHDYSVQLSVSIFCLLFTKIPLRSHHYKLNLPRFLLILSHTLLFQGLG